jgi:hypothetical protein
MMLTDFPSKPREQEPPRGASRILRYSRIAIVIAAIYVVVVLLMRWHQNRAYLAKAKAQQTAQQRAEDERSLESLGGTAFTIEGFYAMPGEIRRGDSVNMCYSVANAQSVKIEPETNHGVWPSLNRCFEITPKKTTTYTLTATDAHGQTKTAWLTIQVH